MGKIKCIVSYDGTDYAGFQIQPHARTVQGELEKALAKVHKKQPIRLHPSGRTDAGVHAIGQVIHFESPLCLQKESWKKALNALLPDDIAVKEAQLVEDTFHARYDAVEKEYRYYVNHEEELDIFKRHYVYQFPYPLIVKRMQEACRYLEGTHDFTAFASAKATVKGSKVRTLSKVACEVEGNEIVFIFRGDGFLYHMVRIMVGTLLEIGQKRREPEDIVHLLAEKDRRLAGKTAPPEGLYLWNVVYDK